MTSYVTQCNVVKRYYATCVRVCVCSCVCGNNDVLSFHAMLCSIYGQVIKCARKYIHLGSPRDGFSFTTRDRLPIDHACLRGFIFTSERYKTHYVASPKT